VCLLPSHGIFRCFVLIEREDLGLGVDLRCREAHLYVLVLFTLDLQSTFFSLKETVLVLKAFLLE